MSNLKISAVMAVSLLSMTGFSGADRRRDGA